MANYIGSVHVDISITDLAVEQSSLVKGSIILHVELVLSFHVSFHTGHPQLGLAYFTMEFTSECTGNLAHAAVNLQTKGFVEHSIAL